MQDVSMSAKARQSPKTPKSERLWNSSISEQSQPWIGIFQFALASVPRILDFYPFSGLAKPTMWRTFGVSAQAIHKRPARSASSILLDDYASRFKRQRYPVAGKPGATVFYGQPALALIYTGGSQQRITLANLQEQRVGCRGADGC